MRPITSKLLLPLVLSAASCLDYPLAATTSVYVLSSHGASTQPVTASVVPTLSFTASSLVLSHLFGTTDRHPLNVQSAPEDFSAANEALKNNPIVKGDVFEKVGGNLLVIVGGVEKGTDVLPSHEPAFFVSSTYTPFDYSTLVRELSVRSGETLFEAERAGIRLVVGNEGLIAAIPAKPAVAGAFESLSIRYPETAYGVFDAMEDVTFAVEVQYVADVVSALGKARQHVTYDIPDFVGVRMSGLEGIRRKHGVESDQYRNAVAILKDLFEKTVIPDFEQPYTTRAIVTFILTPSTSTSTSSPLSKRALANAATTCHPDLVTCESATNACSGHGTCAQFSTGNTTACFACRCAKINGTVYTGARCELHDLSTDFQLLFWTSVALLITTVGVCYFLFESGKLENGGVTLGSGGPLKQD
ncbi:hypothetical protein BC936DRAFT_138355 [Jimgerdemannia flammicorona]|uniref:Uncharacterized protein n=1 Tax=Jimgerdemannia flammicorona TaxID=994334 RepID=A0A433DNN4_9FUNG|nr:hypothetical protein BC936DRAFT_138355 [Jimgerdemannia flammicorona]